MERDFDKVQMLAMPEEGFNFIRVGFFSLPTPIPTWKTLILGHRLRMKKKLTDPSGAGWVTS